jgi:hypothetical protein
MANIVQTGESCRECGQVNTSINFYCPCQRTRAAY